MGLAALQVALTYSGQLPTGTASPRKHEFLAERGLDHPIDYRNNDWYEQLMRMTDERGVDLIIDPLGGSESKRSYKALRSTGRLGMFGISSGSANVKGGFWSKLKLLGTAIKMPLFHPVPLMNKNRGVFGVNLGHLWHEKEKARLWMQQLLEGVEDGWLNPHVDATFTYQNVADAHRYIENRKNFGKVILVP
ncbi:MAG: zinc-binding dehydrogenase [Balneolaceae bacterium]|nr:zinc-binding dehydrogenase [Balneolaceae bacterium]